MSAPDLNATIAERSARHGGFSNVARTAQSVKAALSRGASWNTLSPEQAEAIDMIAHKLARIVCGDPNNHENWFDAAGYSMLVADQLSIQAEAA